MRELWFERVGVRLFAVEEKALEMLEGFDAGSVVATSRFLASGAQPFSSVGDLVALNVATLLVRGSDPMHPAEVSDLYAANIPGCVVAPDGDVVTAVGAFARERTGL